MILKVGRDLYLDPTLGQFAHMGFNVPPGVLFLNPEKHDSFGGMLPGNDVSLGYRLRPDVTPPPTYISPDIVEAEAALRSALPEMVAEAGCSR